MSQSLRKRQALRDHDAQPGSGSLLAIAWERYVSLAPPRPDPRSCLLHNGSVLNATGKHATPRMFTKYSVHRSSPFISGSLVQQKTQERRKFARANTRRQPKSKQGAASSGLWAPELSSSSELSLRHGCQLELSLLQSWEQWYVTLDVSRRICLQRRGEFVRTRARPAIPIRGS